MENYSNKEELILVDEKDEVIGKIEKQEAHKKGLLHRALSIFIFNDKKELMLQKRASFKYHSGGLWTNTVCSHPRFGEDLASAAFRRIKEEMGFECINLEKSFQFIYKAHLDNGLIEHELDHVFVGKYNLNPSINKQEVSHWKWIALEDLKSEIKKNPAHYTIWLKIIMEKYFEKIKL